MAITLAMQVVNLALTPRHSMFPSMVRLKRSFAMKNEFRGQNAISCTITMREERKNGSVSANNVKNNSLSFTTVTVK